MGMIKFVVITMKNDLKNSLFYLMAMIISIGVIFNIFNVIFNESIVARKSGDYQTMFVIGITIMIVAILFMLFANSYYLEGKYKEFGVITISGRSVFEISQIIMIRNFIISLFGIVIGAYVGSLFAPIVTGKAYELANVYGADVNYISQTGIVMTSIIMISQFFMVLLTNTGNIYRKKVKELMIGENQAYIPDTRQLKFPGWYYVMIFLSPFTLLFLPIEAKDKMSLVQIAVLVASYGTQGVVRYFIPGKIYKMKSESLIVDKNKLVIVSNLHNSLQKSTYLILTLILATVIVLGIACGYEQGSVMNLMGLTSFIVVTIVMSFTIVYKFLVEAITRKKVFKQLKLLGYTKNDIRKIITTEVIAYYMIIVGIALSHTLLIIGTSVLGGSIDANTAINLIGIYLGVFLMTSIISYIGYRKISV